MQPTSIGIYKLRLLSIFLISFFGHVNVFAQTTTAVPDTNFEQALINMNIDTNGLNGNILNNDAVGVHYLDVSNQYIQDLSGIEAFTNLKKLNCSYNILSSLNISQNSHLEEINANDNIINSIDLSQNTKLHKVQINSNQLSSIDVSANFSLEDLSVSLNNLTVLDVSANSSLEFLGCYANQIQELDLLNNSQLKYLHVDFNELEELDVSQNVNLNTLTCSNNNLNNLAVAQNTELNYLDCRNNNLTSLDIGINTQLKRLFISDNNINEIDLSNAPELLLFYARFNNLSALDISNNPDLKWIKCEGNNLSMVDFRNGNNSHISEFVMTQNSNLSCIYVDDAEASFLDNWIIDDVSAFVEDESACEALSVSEANKFTFQIFPNPATEHVIVSIQTKGATFELYSIKGQLIHSQILNFGNNYVPLNNYSTGLYLAKIITESTLETKKLLLN